MAKVLWCEDLINGQPTPQAMETASERNSS